MKKLPQDFQVCSVMESQTGPKREQTGWGRVYLRRGMEMKRGPGLPADLA